MWTDLTPLKRSAKALRTSQTELRAVLDAFPGFIAAIDQDFRYSYVNAATARQLGRSADELPGTSVAEVLPPQSVRRTGWVR
jgi:PAS domain S-box-containing protein